MGRHRAQLPGNERRQSVGRQRRARGSRLRRGAVPARGRSPACTCRDLDDRQFAVFVAQGRVNVRVRVLELGETARIDTPNTQVVLTRPGLYRVDVSERSRAHAAHRARRRGERPHRRRRAAGVAGPDRGRRRHRPALRERAQRRRHRWLRYVGGQPRSPLLRDARRITFRRRWSARADLDQYGTWSQVPEYGAVWYPSDVGTDWAPYRNGYWTEVGAWGPTWVDYAPWGYAPFHYGRWAYRRRPLGLVPGRLRRAAAVGAGAGRMGGRLRLELVGDGRRARLRMGSAGVGRAVLGPGGDAARTAAGTATTGRMR